MKKLLMSAACLVAAASMAQAEKLTVLLDWFVNPDHGTLYVAEELGYFADAGLEVEMIEPTDPSQPPLLVGAGRADLAVSYQPQLHLLVEEAITRVGTLVATLLHSLVVQKMAQSSRLVISKARLLGSVLVVLKRLFSAPCWPRGVEHRRRVVSQCQLCLVAQHLFRSGRCRDWRLPQFRTEPDGY